MSNTYEVTLAQATEPVKVAIQAQSREDAIEETWRQFGIATHILSVKRVKL